MLSCSILSHRLALSIIFCAWAYHQHCISMPKQNRYHFFRCLIKKSSVWIITMADGMSIATTVYYCLLVSTFVCFFRMPGLWMQHRSFLDAEWNKNSEPVFIPNSPCTLYRRRNSLSRPDYIPDISLLYPDYIPVYPDHTLRCLNQICRQRIWISEL